MALIVQKYGGSSVANTERVNNVAQRIIDTYKDGNDVIVVVSAQGDTTDNLIDKAYQVNPNPSKREMDMLLSTGEQISIALLAMAIEKYDCPVVSLTGAQVGIKTSSIYSNARIESICSERISSEIEQNRIVIVAGFQGVDMHDNITTLGRGGSDTTAVALAAAMNADFCEIYTDVDGVYTCDPRVVKGAVKLNEISYDEMLELASLGAKVLHNRSVELAKKFGVKLVVRSSMNRNEGTIVKEVDQVEKMVVSGVAHDEKTSRIAVIGIEDKPGKAYNLFKILAENNINVDIILQSIARDGTRDISFTVDEPNLERTVKLIEENLDILTGREVTYSNDVAKVSIVGAGMANNPGVASMMFEALAEVGVNIKMISTSEIKISCLVDRQHAEQAVKAIHKKFELDKLEN